MTSTLQSISHTTMPTLPTVICPRPGALSDDAVWRLSVVNIGPKSRTERPRKTKIGTEVAHVTRDSDTTFKVKRSNVKVARPLWLAVLAGQNGHRVSNRSICMYDVYRVSTCSPGRGHIVAASRLQLVLKRFLSQVCPKPQGRADLRF